MGLSIEAFFILISKGGGLFKEASCRPCKKVGQSSPQGTVKW